MEEIVAKQALVAGEWQDHVLIHLSAGQIVHVGPAPEHMMPTVGLALPAPANLHSHSFQRAMSGMTEARGADPQDSFWTWRRLMYRFLDQLSPDQIEAIAAQVFVEMLEAGYASVAEFHYLHHNVGGVPYDNLAELSDRIIAAAVETGIGLTLLPVLYQFGGADKRPLVGGQQRFGNDPEQFSQLHEKASASIGEAASDFAIGAAPHSLRAVDQVGLQQAIAIAGSGPIHMHLAEQVAEVEEIQHSLNARPTEWLLDQHDVDPRWCLIHCTQMTDDETRRLAQTGAVAGLCPITEANLGDGVFPGTAFMGQGGQIGFGSDSNVHISLFEELKMLEYSQRLRDKSRAALANDAHSTGRVLIDAAVRGGAQAAGRDSGAIAVGMNADILGLDIDNEWIANRSGDMALDMLIFGGHGHRCVTDVWSAGRHVVTGGRHSQHGRISERFRKVMAELQDGI